MKTKYPNLKIYTNFSCDFADGKISTWRDLIELENINIYDITEKEYEKRIKWCQENVFMCIDNNNNIVYKKIVNDGIIFGFDEIHLTFESSKWSDAPDNLLDYISQQRKLHKQIVASSQVFTRIDKKLREQTNYVIECISLFMGRLVIISYYRTVEYIANGEKFDKGNRKRRCKKRYVYIATDELRSKYNTEEIMKDLQIGVSKDKRILNLLKDIKRSD